MKFRVASYLVLCFMLHFSFSLDWSQDEKHVQESTESQQGENMCDESLTMEEWAVKVWVKMKT